MNTIIILDIITEALNILKFNMSSDKVQADINIGAAIVRIVQAANKAYQDHTGQPLDESLINPEEPIK